MARQKFIRNAQSAQQKRAKTKPTIQDAGTGGRLTRASVSKKNGKDSAAKGKALEGVSTKKTFRSKGAPKDAKGVATEKLPTKRKPVSRQKARNRKIAEASGRGRLFKRASGLLSLKTPPKWVDIAKRNAVESPLLRIPPEVRSKIYEYVLGGLDVHVETTWRRKIDRHGSGSRSRFDADLYFSDPSYRTTSSGFPATRSQDIAHPGLPWSRLSDVPRICRQIYAETATLVYSLSTFCVPFGREILNWHEVLLPAQREAIKSITLGFWAYWYLQSGQQRVLKRLFPGLQRIVVIRSWGLENMTGFWTSERKTLELREWMKKWEEEGLEVSLIMS
ncbi:hypothetical protein BCR34DRAFT_572310 [Clohesyomyces aquaticus]|uniref:DUF7730 domain-containing protein n=1 Tax=Clohesyomyces aquaticus TaxID=1231657 RepID=A0A1Y1Z4N7_9PLEO|nr:hypothetical protein BCR34DRAFT_572310 [Clohesyomyces aquaticus]